MATGKIVHICGDIRELLNKNRNINTAYGNLVDVKYPMALKVPQKAKSHSMMTEQR